MIPVDQTLFGKNGNCWAACIASILEVPLEGVPNFCALPGNWLEKAEEWLRKHHELTVLGFRARGEGAFYCRPALHHVMSGPGPRGLLHAVVGFQGEMVHDPHPSRNGLIEAEEYEFLIQYEAGMSEV